MSEITNGQVENEMEPSGDISPVEIVHAQSTIEVIASLILSETKETNPCVQTSPKAPVNPEPAVETTYGMDRQCEESIRCKKDVYGVRMNARE